MKRRTYITILILLFLSFSACKTLDSPNEPTSANTSTTTSTPSGDCPNGRSGAVCKDGTTSNATGSGACSSHGGVRSWICK